MKEYAIYKGDDLIAMGTIDELAQELNVKPETIRFYGTKSHLKRCYPGAKVLVSLDDDIEEKEELES